MTAIIAFVFAIGSIIALAFLYSSFAISSKESIKFISINRNVAHVITGILFLIKVFALTSIAEMFGWGFSGYAILYLIINNLITIPIVTKTITSKYNSSNANKRTISRRKK